MRTVITLAVLILLGAPALAQRGGGGDRGGPGGGGAPGGGGGFQRGGGGRSPDDSFNRLISSYGGSGDVLDYSKVPQANRDFYNMMVQRSGGEPMPTSGTISRADYAVAYTKRMEAMQGNRGGGAPNNNAIPAPGGAPAGPPAEKAVSDDEVGRMMRRLDRNDDNRISIEEANNDKTLGPNFAFYDKNNDGFIDMAELKVYAMDKANRRTPDLLASAAASGGMNPNGGYPPPGYYPPYGGEYPRERQVVPPPEEEKAVALRFGKLPLKELPSWWSELDTDKDGQIGMYEWRAAKKPMADFLAMDLNGDGYITAEEYLRFKKLEKQAAGETSVSTDGKPASATATPGSRDGRDSGRDRGKGGDRTPKDGKKSNDGNPFRSKN